MQLLSLRLVNIVGEKDGYVVSINQTYLMEKIATSSVLWKGVVIVHFVVQNSYYAINISLFFNIY